MRSKGHFTADAEDSRRVDVGGMRGAKVSGGGVPVVDELRGQVPVHMPNQKVTAAAPGHGLPPAGFQTQRTQASITSGTRNVHGQLHHARRSLEVGTASSFKIEVGAVCRNARRLSCAHPETFARRSTSLGLLDGQETRADLHRLARENTSSPCTRRA